MNNQKHYRMMANGLTGKIKKTEIVVEVERQIGLSLVQKPGTDITDYVLPDDRVEIKDQEVPQ